MNAAHLFDTDKACIDQQNIEVSLAALPLYLAGCDRLVIVAGPTYASRLWCVIEVFTFLYMGGSLSRIDVLPTGDGTREQVDQRFMEFDAQHARCFLEEDRQRLLGVIESGFGDYAAFNKLVHGALIGRGRTTLAQRAWLEQAALTEAKPLPIAAPSEHRSTASNLNQGGPTKAPSGSSRV